jgi:hypothetical protein
VKRLSLCIITNILQTGIMYKWLQGGVGLQLVRWWLRPDFFMEEKESFQIFQNGRCHLNNRAGLIPWCPLCQKALNLYKVSVTAQNHTLIISNAFYTQSSQRRVVLTKQCHESTESESFVTFAKLIRFLKCRKSSPLCIMWNLNYIKG